MHACGRTDGRVTHRKSHISRGQDDPVRIRDEHEAAVTLHKPGNVGEPPGIDVEVFVRLPSKEKRGQNIM